MIRLLRSCGRHRLLRLQATLAGSNRRGRLALDRAGLLRDDITQHIDDLDCLGVLEINDVVAGIGISLLIEAPNQIVEEFVLARIGDENDLIGAIVGVVGGRAAELLLERAGEDGAQFADEVAGLRMGQLIKFRFHPRGHGAIDLPQQSLDALQIADAVGDQQRIRIHEENRSAEVRIQDLLQHGLHFLRARKFHLEELRCRSATGLKFQGGAFDHFRCFGANIRDVHHLHQEIVERGDPDRIQRQHRLDCTDRLRLRDESVDVEIVGGRLKLLRTQDDFARINFESGQHRIDISVRELEADHFFGAGAGCGCGRIRVLWQGPAGSRCLRTGIENENERKN